MARTEEALRERVRETPLSERLKTCEKYVANMCAERRPPKMTIPLQHYDEDFYICTTLADAQATIAALTQENERLKQGQAVDLKNNNNYREQVAALQARVKELEQWVQDQSTANLETMRRTDEMQSRALEAEQQLTQRTAELEAAKAIQVIDLKNNNEYREQVANLHAELERVRGLIKALPKVEGEIEVKL